MLAARVRGASNEAVHGAIALWVRADWRRRGRVIAALALVTLVVKTVLELRYGAEIAAGRKH